MKLDPLKLVKHRQRLGYSQQDVANKSALSRRTIERAEAGISINNENAASIAAALEATLGSLVLNENASEAVPAYGKGVTLKLATSGRDLLDKLDRAEMGVIECDVEATKDNLPLLKKIAHLIESNINDPMNPRRPVKRTLSERLELIAAINEALDEAQAGGVGLFATQTWVKAYFPDFDEFGEPYWRENAKSVGCRAARIVISDAGTEKIVRSTWIAWPLGIEHDDDGEVPF